jgi:hypothetical protein
VQFIAERADLVSALKLTMPPDLIDDFTGVPDWSAFAVCQAFAERRGYVLARAGRPDTHRAGLEIVRSVVEGKFPFFLLPPAVDGPVGESDGPVHGDGDGAETGVAAGAGPPTDAHAEGGAAADEPDLSEFGNPTPLF